MILPRMAIQGLQVPQIPMNTIAAGLPDMVNNLVTVTCMILQ